MYTELSKICHLVITTMSNTKFKLLDQNSIKENDGREVALLLSDGEIRVPRNIMDTAFVKDSSEVGSSYVCYK